MQELIATINIETAEQLASILKSFSPGESPLYLRINGKDQELKRVELRRDEVGHYFVFFPSNSNDLPDIGY
jgi:hypothetical protein